MKSVKGRVLSLLHAAVRAGITPGAVAAWGRGGVAKLTTVVVGIAEIPDRKGAHKATEATWYDLASLTKPLVTTTLFLLARRCSGVTLKTRVGDLLDELPPDRLPGQLTFESLLTHSSGLPAWAPLYLHGVGHEHVLRAIACLEPIAPAGRRVVYSCPGFILLGMALERAIGLDLSTAFRRLVLAPLELENELGFCPDPRMLPVAGGASTPSVERHLLLEADADPAVIPFIRPGLPDDGNARSLGGVSGNSGLFGSALGVATLALEFAPGGGRLLTAAEGDEATALRTPGLEQARGLGWQLATTRGCSAGPALSPDAFGHVGFTGTSVWVDPARQQVMVLLTNRHHPGHREHDLHPLRRRYNTIINAIT